MNFKFLFLRVPDFRAQVEADAKQLPPFFQKLSEQEQDEYLRSVTMQRSIIWACKTAAAAYNLGILAGGCIILTNGSKLLAMLAAYLTK